MSGNSCASALQTAPMVIDLPRGAPSSTSGSSMSAIVSGPLPLEEGQLVLADLELVAVLEAVRLDPPAVDVGAVERAEVVEVEVAAAADEQGVVARDRDVVEEEVGVRAPADRHPVAVEREALADPSAARADYEHRAVGGRVVEVDRDELAGLPHAVRRGRRLAGVLLGRGPTAEEVPAALAVVRPVGVDEAAVRAVQRHGCGRLLRRGRRRLVAPRAPGEDVGESPDVVARDHVLAALVLLAQAVDEL